MAVWALATSSVKLRISAPALVSSACLRSARLTMSSLSALAVKTCRLSSSLSPLTKLSSVVSRATLALLSAA